ncbi:MAG: rod shape-determining protein MreD [Deltaproteobacteria bacterium]|nr:rod shape-determining protein MreD [Deltaproteobacteria bacterium]
MNLKRKSIIRDFAILLPLSIIYYSIKSTLLPGIPVPDITVLILLYLITKETRVEWAVFAFALGYIEDTFSGSMLGVSSFSLCATYILLYMALFKVDLTVTTTRILTGAVMVLFKGLLTYLLLSRSGIEINYFSTFVPTAFITALFAPAIIRFFILISSHKEQELN